MADFSFEDSLPLCREPLESVSPVDRFFEYPAFCYTAESSEAFLAAMREAMLFQYGHSRILGALYDSESFDPVSVRTEEDVKRIPFLSVSALKERDLTTLPYSQIVLELRSSGTSGQRSRMQLDMGSLLRVRRMAWQVFSGLGLTAPEKVHNYLCFTYDPAVAKDLGTAWTDKLLSGFTAGKEIYYAFRWDGEKKDFYFDADGSVKALKSFEEQDMPVRIVGFPAFALKLTDDFKNVHGRYPKLKSDSSVITGGGWKTLEDGSLPKKVYRQILADRLGIPVGNVRDLYGMVEHGVPYVDCPEGNFHVPVYGRIIVRDPATLAPLPYGARGLLQFVTPYLTSYPSLSVLSSDFGVLREKCGCGLGGPVLEISGRAGVRKLKGCAVSAASMLSGRGK